MTGALRCRLAVGILAFVLVWPPVHHVLARTLDLDPWSFFGWAMYSVPNLKTAVRAAGLESLPAVAPVAQPDWGSIDPRARVWLHEYAQRRERWGKLLPPDAVAERIFALQPELPALLVRVRRWEIDRETGRISPDDVDYVYDRAALGR